MLDDYGISRLLYSWTFNRKIIVRVNHVTSYDVQIRIRSLPLPLPSRFSPFASLRVRSRLHVGCEIVTGSIGDQ